MTYTGPRRIMQEVADMIPAFAGATYENMGLTGHRLAEIAENVE
jgi:NADH-quinone oxidoreductase subunit G